MGWDAAGALGDGKTNNVSSPEQVLSSNVTAIAGGGLHSLCLKSDGSLWVMGDDEAGQLGDGFTNIYSSIPEQIFPLPRPVLASGISSKTNLQFAGTCQFGNTFYLLASTNLTQPLSQWTLVWTNSVTARGTNNFTTTLTNAVISGPAQRFYILQSQ